MKYILTLTLMIIGVFFIVIGLTAPSTLATVTISPYPPQETLHETGVPYPSSTSSSSPTIFPSETTATISDYFAISPFTIDNIYITSVTAYLYVDGKSYTPTTPTNIPLAQATIIQEINNTNGLEMYGIYIQLQCPYNNPIPGNTTTHSFKWYVSVTYKYTSGELLGQTSTATGTSQTYYGTFSPSAVYPGYFVLKFTYPNNGTTQYWSLNKNTNINIRLPYSLSNTFLTLTFIYVEYNASGNTMAGFSYAYITINSLYATINTKPYYNISNTNTTFYNGYNALYVNVPFNTNPYYTNVYTIEGYVVYNVPNYGLERIMEMALPFNVTGTNITGSQSISTGPPHSNIPSLIDISIGTIFLIGAIFTFRRRL